MTSLTGSIRLADVHASALAPRKTAAGVTVASPAESIADFAKAAVHSVATIDSISWIPGRVAVAKFAQALSHRGESTRTIAQELKEERLNAITHGLGLALSAAGFVYLLTSVVMAGDWLCVVSCAVYGASLMLMYVASTLLHAARMPHLKLRFQLCDHVAIYLLIAGTYTPLFAGLMQGYVGFTLLACVWLLAAIGIAIKVKYAERLEDTSTLPYVGLGWLALVAIKPIVAVLPAGGLALLVAGGVSYSAGVIFYCRDDKRYFHAIWHLFVMAGTALHFCTILFYVAT